jgi:hypothetical protein
MGLKISDCFPSAYFKGEDVKIPQILTIADVTQELVGQERKLRPVTSFRGEKKMLILNKTNAFALESLFGDDVDDWRGQRIELYSERVPFQGKLTDAVRVRVPRRAPAGRSAPEADTSEFADDGRERA